jgi:hypothetical protein
MDSPPLNQTLKGTLPAPGEQVIVCCQSFRCLGAFAADKKWRSASTQEELREVRSWSRLGDDQFIEWVEPSSCAVN